MKNFILYLSTTALLLSSVPDDPYLGALWSYNNEGYFNRYYGTVVVPQSATTGVDMNIFEAWEAYPLEKEETEPVIVAVIDTGIDYKHPDLRNAMWVNPGEIPDNQIDDDGNGYIDDVYGWDFYNNDNSICHYIETENGYAADPNDNDNHGTHCAGIIAATADNSIGIAGVASNVNVKVMSLKIHGGVNGHGSVANAIKAIRYAEQMGAKICNLSWGTFNYSEALELTIKNSSMLFVTAAGNSGGNNNSTPVSPASLRLPNLISVAFIDYDGLLDPDSNYGLSTVDIAAPGKEIYSTLVGSYGFASGSSMAAPHVTGLAAMIYAYRDDIYAAQVKELIINTMQSYDTLNGYLINPGIPDAELAIQSLSSLKADNIAPFLGIATSFDKETIKLSATGYDAGGSGVKCIRYAHGSRSLEYFRQDTSGIYATDLSVSLNKGGPYTFYIEDYAGNYTIQEYYVKDDITSPELNASYKITDGNSMFVISLSVKDTESGIRSMKYLVGEHTTADFSDGGDILSAAVSEHTISTSSDITALTIYLEDYRGNATTYTIYPEYIPATSVHLTVTERFMKPSETLFLGALLLPWDSTDHLHYSSSDSSVLAVNEDGTVVALTEGTATITAVSDSGASAACVITVR